jgi:CheY-like chemotaxis protein
MISPPGKGSTFLLSLPDQPGNRDFAPATRSPSSPVDAAIYEQPQTRHAPGIEPPLRLLLADDHRVMRQALAMLLNEEADLEVVAEADNGKHAIELVQRFHPDVIIMDVSMPVMDGVSATRIIKRDWPNVRIVGLSMFGREDLARDMFAAGAEAYLSKSDPSEQLLAAIRGNSRHRSSS